jgi:hypothetical protein
MELLLELGVAKAGGAGSGHDREIRPCGDGRTANPEKLANPAFQAIAADGITNLTAYGNT